MRLRHKLFFSLCVALYASIAIAATIEQPLADSTQESAARAIFHELRCVTCEGQSVADSDATLAAQMRMRVRELVAEGNTPEEVLAHFRTRYGDTILMTPPLEQRTALLWLAPLLLLGIGAILVWRTTRHGEPHD